MRQQVKIGVLGLGHSTVLCGGQHDVDILRSVAPSKDRQIIRKSKDLFICYDSRSRNPLYVVEYLRRPHQISARSSKRPSYFVENVLDEFRVRVWFHFDSRSKGQRRRLQRFRIR